MASPADIAREYLEGFNQRDWAKVRSVLHADYAYTGSDGKEETGGPDVALNMMQMYATGFTDVRLRITGQYTQGNTAVTEFTYSGTHNGEFMGVAPSGKRVQGPVITVVDIRDGKIYREREVFDMMNLMAQIGAVSLPAGAVAG